VAKQSKVYGADEAAIRGLNRILTGLVNRTVQTWNAGPQPTIDDSALTSTTLSLARVAGENVATSPYTITGGTFSAPNANYNRPEVTRAPELTITPASLAATVANQSKVYGADDPALTGINPILTGLVNRTVQTWNAGPQPTIDDSALTSTTLSLARVAGENVATSPYTITGGTFSAPNANYNAPTFTGTPVLTITPASLTATVANQSKVYGADEPALTGIKPLPTPTAPPRTARSPSTTLFRSLTSTTLSLARVAGENVATSPYTITGGTFSAPNANYNAPTFTGTPVLTITPASLTATVANQSKVYG